MENPDSLRTGDLLRNSMLYREFQAEHEEILRHKWIESEKAKHNVGFEWAFTDWTIKHRRKWRKGREKSLDDLLGLILQVSGAGGSTSNLKLKAQPSLGTPIGNIKYPEEITIVDKTFN